MGRAGAVGRERKASDKMALKCKMLEMKPKDKRRLKSSHKTEKTFPQSGHSGPSVPDHHPRDKHISLTAEAEGSISCTCGIRQKGHSLHESEAPSLPGKPKSWSLLPELG